MPFYFGIVLLFMCVLLNTPHFFSYSSYIHLHKATQQYLIFLFIFIKRLISLSASDLFLGLESKSTVIWIKRKKFNVPKINVMKIAVCIIFFRIGLRGMYAWSSVVLIIYWEFVKNIHEKDSNEIGNGFGFILNISKLYIVSILKWKCTKLHRFGQKTLYFYIS